jgi:hypothetical protein
LQYSLCFNGDRNDMKHWKDILKVATAAAVSTGLNAGLFYYFSNEKTEKFGVGWRPVVKKLEPDAKIPNRTLPKIAP